MPACPTCKRPVEWNSSSPWRPFCSERCKLIDFGGWASERNAIPGNANAELLEDVDRDFDEEDNDKP
jgi:uncharacterized protein